MKLLFLLFLTLNVIYLSYCVKENNRKNVDAYKNETILIVPDNSGNCLNLCIATPNCRLYERKNGMCELTLIQLLNNSVVKKLRVKRKGGREVSVPDSNSNTFSSTEISRVARSNGGGSANSYHNSNYYGNEYGSDSSAFFSNKVMLIFIIVAVAVLLLAMFFAYMTIRENAKRGSRYRPPQRSSSAAPNTEPNVHNVNNDMYKHQKPPQFYKKLTYTSKI